MQVNILEKKGLLDSFWGQFWHFEGYMFEGLFLEGLNPYFIIQIGNIFS